MYFPALLTSDARESRTEISSISFHFIFQKENCAKKMRFLKLIFVVMVALAMVAEGARLEKLRIGVTKRAETCEQKARKGDMLSVHYTGKLRETGKVFDSSVERGRPFDFKLGVGQVIRGWDEGVVGMCVGEKRRLGIPAAMAYGERGAGADIPPDSDLVFDVELVAIKNRPRDEM